MGKLILCSGERTNKPYLFTSSGIRVYSMEELCYYIYHHVYYVDEEMISDTLIDWIDTELKLTERAAKLKQLKQMNADLKTLVTVIMCSADYYTEYEIKSLLKLLDEITDMPFIKRKCLKAGFSLKSGNYHEAAAEYERILNSQEAALLSPEEYGDLYHNLGVAKAHTTGLLEAAELFCQAYERNHREESLKQYLYALLLSGRQELFQEKRREYFISAELEQELVDRLDQWKDEANSTALLQELIQMKEEREQGSQNLYQRAKELAASWKERVRQK
ncbi:hypothetical protein H0486_04320 [Lachnospiraceae bacterium MD1]|uniref:Tetratricopeptide repeat protein n=1 Tax=Variimorphobacter saccharofermentans TaxID=2755051 RepID=A0A839JXZ6_9FIRM|nr:hypothetical protein [Variimorphobacter saccharofermentans]MBB2182098.1 hypothetical protein [Variimorphobacter saccharofermentans]